MRVVRSFLEDVRCRAGYSADVLRVLTSAQGILVRGIIGERYDLRGQIRSRPVPTTHLSELLNAVSRIRVGEVLTWSLHYADEAVLNVRL